MDRGFTFPWKRCSRRSQPWQRWLITPRCSGNGQGNGNPASFYCTQLGGSDSFGGVSAAGGGWVKFGSIDEVLEACIFPDDSTIDSWGLLYHSVGTIRGTDLSKVLRYFDPYATNKQSQ